MMDAGNIWSGSAALARFTNPTELAVRKGKLAKHYPIQWRGQDWPDVEAAYKATVTPAMTLGQRMLLLADVMEAKFRTYPELIEEITAAGGEEWIFRCEHKTWAKTAAYARWEGRGRDSMFLRCLAEVWRRIAK